MPAPREGLPSGVVTLVFTDIEGSTRLLTELGTAYRDVLDTHRRLLRAAFARPWRGAWHRVIPGLPCA